MLTHSLKRWRRLAARRVRYIQVPSIVMFKFSVGEPTGTPTRSRTLDASSQKRLCGSAVAECADEVRSGF